MSKTYTDGFHKFNTSLHVFPVVTNASELLGLDAFQLSEVLTQRSIILRGEEICSPLTIEQVSINKHILFSSRLIYLCHFPVLSHTYPNPSSGFPLCVVGH